MNLYWLKCCIFSNLCSEIHCTLEQSTSILCSK
uniref:Uncharacterized protein n=1 Tax=Arundo donax TaxID=35708 RepID=A0A0A9ASN7_ARUDO